MDKPYTFRTLAATDVMPMFRIISAIGVNEFASCFQSDTLKALVANKKKDSAIVDMAGLQVMLDAANILLKNLPKCENEIFELLASVSGLTVDEVKALGLATFAEMIVEFVKKEEFRDFIGVVSKLFK